MPANVGIKEFVSFLHGKSEIAKGAFDSIVGDCVKNLQKLSEDNEKLSEENGRLREEIDVLKKKPAGE